MKRTGRAISHDTGMTSVKEGRREGGKRREEWRTKKCIRLHCSYKKVLARLWASSSQIHPGEESCILQEWACLSILTTLSHWLGSSQCRKCDLGKNAMIHLEYMIWDHQSISIQEVHASTAIPHMPKEKGGSFFFFYKNLLISSFIEILTYT